MTERKFENPLRTIVLNYDERKAETDYEKQLLRDYVALHQTADRLKSKVHKLHFEYTEWNDKIQVAENAFKPVKDMINDLITESQSIIPGITQKKEADIFSEKIQNSYPAVLLFHQTHLDSLAKEIAALENDYTAFTTLDEQFDIDLEKFDGETTGSLYEKYDDYALDMESFDEDMDLFRDAMPDTQMMHDAQRIMVDNYNLFLDTVKKSYDLWEHLKEVAGKTYDDRGLLDSSLSDSYANGTGNPKNQPIYFIEPGDSKIPAFKTDYAMMANSTIHTFNCSVSDETVMAGDTAMIQEIMLVMQHYPKMIEKWIFAFNIQFKDAYDVPVPEDHWKGNNKYMRWFRELGTLPCSLFFIDDHDARSYILMGDMIADNKFVVNNNTLEMEGDLLEEVCDRLLMACFSFHLYCHNTGTDPQPATEAVLADFGLPVTYERVMAEYKTAIEKGIKVKTVPKA